MSKLKLAVITLSLVVAAAVPFAASADTASWWCNTPFGTWWGVQNCQAPSGGAGGVLVYVAIANQGGASLSSSDFNVLVSGQSPNPSTFAGSINGSPVILYPGSYSVSVPDTRGYGASYSTGCSGTLSAGQYSLCVITLSRVAASGGGSVPYSGSAYYQPLTCTSAYPTVSLGNLGRFVAAGGKGAYSWATASGSYLNSGATLNTSFMVSGTQTVTVTSGSEVATCTVTVTSQPGYGAAPGTYVSGTNTQNASYSYNYPASYGGTPAYGGSYAAQSPNVTIVSRTYPALPNTGFEPQNAAAWAMSVVLLLGAAIAAYPHARKALAVVVA